MWGTLKIADKTSKIPISTLGAQSHVWRHVWPRDTCTLADNGMATWVIWVIVGHNGQGQGVASTYQIWCVEVSELVLAVLWCVCDSPARDLVLLNLHAGGGFIVRLVLAVLIICDVSRSDLGILTETTSRHYIQTQHGKNGRAEGRTTCYVAGVWWGGAGHWWQWTITESRESLFKGDHWLKLHFPGSDSSST